MFKTKPYDPSRVDKRSPAQKAQATRSFQIFQLRGLSVLCRRLTGERRVAAMAIIDQELSLLGAETEAVRAGRRRAESEAHWERLRQTDIAAQFNRVAFMVDTIVTDIVNDPDQPLPPRIIQ